MRRAGGVFVFGFMTLGAFQALTGVIPSMPSVEAAAQSTAAEKSKTPSKAKEFTGTSAPIRDTAGLVPDRYEALINKWGNYCETLTPALLAAQLRQESGWNPQAQSPAQAQGIAQFIPGTWATHGIDGNGDGKRDVWNPEDAIPSAAKYDCTVASYVRNVPGERWKNMLAAYNAGAGAVKKYGGIPPYRETQNYVRAIEETARRLER